jgi:hypothetical protein
VVSSCAVAAEAAITQLTARAVANGRWIRESMTSSWMGVWVPTEENLHTRSNGATVKAASSAAAPA